MFRFLSLAYAFSILNTLEAVMQFQLLREQANALGIRSQTGDVDSGLLIQSFRDFYAFEQHVSTCRRKRGLDMVPEWYDAPAFYFSNAHALHRSGDEIFAPQGSIELDFELELGVVIGEPGTDIAEADAWDHVLGLTIVNDWSARDLQRSEMKVGLGPAKGKDFATSIGPDLIPLDAVRDRIDSRGHLNLAMCARINAREVSRGNAADMYFTWPQLIRHASMECGVNRGDLLGSGTVGTGCILELGAETVGGWLKAGDVVELEIECLGVLTNRIGTRNAVSSR